MYIFVYIFNMLGYEYADSFYYILYELLLMP